MINIVSAKYVKDNSPLPNNIDDSEIHRQIVVAQDLQTESLLGKELYDKILNDINNNSLEGIYKELVDNYVLKPLVLWTYYHILPYLYVGKIEADDYKQVRDEVKLQANEYDKRLLNFLRINKSSIVEYDNISKSDEIVETYKKPKLICGIYTPKNK